ncbi:hypothetical protein PG991_014654 [Apiospora marii]|uniref:Uncharacterized protein n=1 Tax=Apiospora marii TaxID=335849 RepID=A0ABR1R487_9PEZI
MVGTDYTYTTSDRWAGAYEDGGFATFYTEGYGSVLVEDGTTVTCGSGSSMSAGTMTIYQTYPNGSPLWITYFCAQNWAANTIYRQLQETSSTTSTSTSSMSTTAATTTLASPGSSTNPTAASTQTDQDTDLADAAVTAPSQAWIAGAVVGPIAGCALVGFLVFWIMRRRAKKALAAANAAAIAASGAAASSTYNDNNNPHGGGPYHDNPQSPPLPPPSASSRPVSSAPPYAVPGGGGVGSAWDGQKQFDSRPLSSTTYASAPPQELANVPGTNSWHFQNATELAPPPPAAAEIGGTGGYGAATPPPPQELSNIPGSVDHQGWCTRCMRIAGDLGGVWMDLGLNSSRCPLILLPFASLYGCNDYFQSYRGVLSDFNF